MAKERDEIYVHMQPRFVFVGGQDPEKWLVGVELSDDAKAFLTTKDREEIGQGIANVIRARRSERKQGMIVLPGTGLLIPANLKKG